CTDGTVFKTDDAGKTWNKEKVDVLNQPGESWIFSNKKGDLFHLNRTGETKIETSISGDQGSTWKSLGELKLTDMVGYPSLFFDPEKDRLALTYVKNSDCRVDLMFVQSSNSKKFDDPRSLLSEKLDCGGVLPTNPDVVIDPREYMFAVWARGEEIYLDRSYDDGDTWLRSDILIYTRKGSRGRPLLTVDRSESVLKGAMYLVWTDSVSDGSLLNCSRSTNNGDAWSGAIKVHPNIADVQPVRVLIDQSNGFLYVLYYLASGDQTYDLILAYSDDGAQSFNGTRINSEPLRISAEHMQIPVSGLDVYRGKILVSWSSFVQSKQRIHFRELAFTELQSAGDQLGN
ncbi:MAG: sialidase family protein, partial [Cyclobacteriaceae bacterium]